MESVYTHHKEGVDSNLPLPINKGSRLVFPAYYENKEPKGTRISEQELRFAFVEEFNCYCEENSKNLFYSVETPTKEKYSGFSDVPKQDDGGRSAEFDMVIYDENLNRVCLIEFKANNADKVDHEKDFLKLDVDEKDNENVLRYFIEIVKSYKDRTIKSLKENKFKYNRGNLPQIRCYALEGESSGKTKNQGEDISSKFYLLQLIIHRGSHQIGGNCVELVSPNARILIDCGLPLDYDEKSPEIQVKVHQASEVLVCS